MNLGVGKKSCMPSISKPAYVCIGRNKYGCKKALCYDCYKANIIDTNANYRRKRRSCRDNNKDKNEFHKKKRSK